MKKMKIEDLSIHVVITALFLPLGFAFPGNIVISGSTTTPHKAEGV
jgi:hypothetical protein